MGVNAVAPRVPVKGSESEPAARAQVVACGAMRRSPGAPHPVHRLQSRTELTRSRGERGSSCIVCPSRASTSRLRRRDAESPRTPRCRFRRRRGRCERGLAPRHSTASDPFATGPPRQLEARRIRRSRSPSRTAHEQRTTGIVSRAHHGVARRASQRRDRQLPTSAPTATSANRRFGVTRPSCHEQRIAGIVGRARRGVTTRLHHERFTRRRRCAGIPSACGASRRPIPERGPPRVNCAVRNPRCRNGL